MSRIEDKIRKNVDYFNNNEPSAEHLSNFVDRLEKQNTSRQINLRQTSLKIAAAALVLITASYFVFHFVNKQNIQSENQVIIIKYADELDEVLQYYDAASSIKVEEIEQYALNPEQAKKMREKAGRQLENLDAKLAEIEKEYMKNPGNENLRAALVNTKRKKSEVMNQIVKQMEIAHSGLYSINTETIQF